MTDSTLVAAIAKAGVQQHNAIRYLTKYDGHKKFLALNRIRKYGKYLDQNTLNKLLNEL